MEIILAVEGVTLGQLVQEHYLNAFSELFLLQSFKNRRMKTWNMEDIKVIMKYNGP